MRTRRFSLWLVPFTLVVMAPAFGADPCAEYKWDIARERALHTGAAAEWVASGASVEQAALIKAERLYAVRLQPQEAVKLAAAPSKKMLADGASGGLLKLRVAEAGRYRIAVDTGLWLDLVRDGKLVDSNDFQGITECKTPRKIVLYDLPAGTEVVVQASASSTPDVRLSVTRVPTP